jgi:hypothetical protein
VLLHTIDRKLKVCCKRNNFINNALAHNKQFIEQAHGAVTLGFLHRRWPVQISAMILPIITRLFHGFS